MTEHDYLKETIDLAKKELEKARHYSEDTKAAILAAKKELRENTSHSISNLWSSEDFEALVELNQYMDPITSKIESFEETERKITQLELMIQSPYFARIDFKFDDEDYYEKIYIGRSSLKKENSYDLHIYDWRSPIASVFYRFTLGKAYYDAPGGRIHGNVNLKRQYEIKNVNLEYYFDTDIQIVDEFLRKMLSQNTTSQMKTIVETIQKEQDIVIRDLENDLMMVQGVAGSGKTSIALHRAAYMMYQGLASRLTAQNILILSPNSLFEQYISHVLPELGEENIVSVVLEEILGSILKTNKIQTKNEYLEQLVTFNPGKDLIKSAMEFKSSSGFLTILNRFIHDLPGKCSDFDKLSDTFPAKEAGKEIRIYKLLLTDRTYFYSLAKDVALPECIDDILSCPLRHLDSERLYYDDTAVLAYIHLKLNGSEQYKGIKQVLIDEAQDYYPLHYEIFRILFPRSQYTILGDINQTLEKEENLSFYQQIKTILNKKKASLVVMDKSFRCTNEILSYSLKFLPGSCEIKSFNRNGEAPKLHTANDFQTLKEQIHREIINCQEKGCHSIGLICKNAENARRLYESLKEDVNLKFIMEERAAAFNGIFSIPVYMSKGLEFDAVLICDADKANYRSEEDKKLLYVACTRALHRLSLFCEGEPSTLL